MIMGAAGIVVLLIMVFVWRKMEHKEPLKINGKTIGTALVAIVGALLLGAGMSLVMAFEQLIIGTLVGIVGIVVLLCLIPLIKGFQ